jgi:hypothetical protein
MSSPVRKPVKERPIADADWRMAMLEHVRLLIKKTLPAITEERKWKKPSNAMQGIPVWSLDGIICTGETYKAVIKLTFPKGASLADPAKLFNASLDGGARRAIDLREGDTLNARAFATLLRAAAKANAKSEPEAKPKANSKPDRNGARNATKASTSKSKVRLLSGENPQITKGYGDAPVKNYLAAIPGWKQKSAAHIDALIEQAIPNVRKAVKWNSPLYAAPDAPPSEWFLSMHCFAKYIKIAFFRGTSLTPMPPGESKQPAVRYLDICEDGSIKQGGTFDEKQFIVWVKAAARLPHVRM